MNTRILLVPENFEKFQHIWWPHRNPLASSDLGIDVNVPNLWEILGYWQNSGIDVNAANLWQIFLYWQNSDIHVNAANLWEIFKIFAYQNVSSRTSDIMTPLSVVIMKSWRTGILFFSKYCEKNDHREWLLRMFCAIFLRADELSSPMTSIYVQDILKAWFISSCHKKDHEQVFCISQDNTRENVKNRSHRVITGQIDS